LSSLDLEIQEEPVLLSRESNDMQDTASSFYMAAENGDVAQDKTNTTADAKNEDADEEVLSYQEENAPDEFVIQEGPRIFDSDGKTDNHDVDILGKPWWTLVWTK